VCSDTGSVFVSSIQCDIDMASESNTRLFYGWVVVGSGCAILVLVWGFQYSYGVFFTELCNDLGWSRTAVSGAYSLFMLWHSACYLVAGGLNDKYGPRTTLGVSVTVLAAGYALMATVNTQWQLYVVYGIIIGTGCGFCFAPITSTVSRWFVKRRGMALGIAVAGIGIGTMAMAPCAQFLISRLEWRTSYLVIAAVLLAIGLPISRLMRLDPAEKGLLPDGVGAMSEERGSQDPLVQLDFVLSQAMKTRAFWLLFVMFAAFNCAVQMLMVHLKAYVTGFGITPMLAATLIGLIGIGSAVGRVVMGHASDRIGRRKTFLVSYLVLAAMMMWLLKTREPWELYLFSGCFGFFYGSCVPLFPAITADWFGIRHVGAIFGAILLAPGLGGAIGSLLGGHVFDSTGSYSGAITIGAMALLLSAVCSLVIRAPRLSPPG